MQCCFCAHWKDVARHLTCVFAHQAVFNAAPARTGAALLDGVDVMIVVVVANGNVFSGSVDAENGPVAVCPVPGPQPMHPHIVTCTHLAAPHTHRHTHTDARQGPVQTAYLVLVPSHCLVVLTCRGEQERMQKKGWRCDFKVTSAFHAASCAAVTPPRPRVRLCTLLILAQSFAAGKSFSTLGYRARRIVLPLVEPEDLFLFAPVIMLNSIIYCA